LRVAIVGFGSIARRHITNLCTFVPKPEVLVWRQHSRDLDLGDVSELVDRVVFDINEVRAWNPHAALLTNPASLHIETAQALVDEGIHLLIEKPLANSLIGIDELLQVCRERSVVLLVGYNLRFCRPLLLLKEVLDSGRIGRPLTLRAEVGQYLPDWRSGKDYRSDVSAQKALGGGVILELSHELDYARWLMGEVSRVQAQVDRLSDLDIDVEDNAEVILKFSNGAVGSIHLDMIQRDPIRQCRIVGSSGMLRWDGIGHRTQLYSQESEGWVDLWQDKTYDVNDMYIGEVRHFFDCIQGNSDPVVSGEDGRRIVELSEAIKRSSEELRSIDLGP
jgi:predicted dehydrogenase